MILEVQIQIFGTRRHTRCKVFIFKNSIFCACSLMKREASCRFSQKIVIFRPPGIFWKWKLCRARARRKFGYGLLKSCQSAVFCPIKKLKITPPYCLWNPCVINSHAGNFWNFHIGWKIKFTPRSLVTEIPNLLSPSSSVNSIWRTIVNSSKVHTSMYSNLWFSLCTQRPCGSGGWRTTPAISASGEL